MGETIQAFVDKIRTEGIHAGQQQAEELLTGARAEADQILAEARNEKDRIIGEAKAEAESALSRAETELRLAARDAVLRLRDALTRGLRAVLSAGAEAHLTDPEFIGNALHEVITQFGMMELQGKPTFRVNVPEEIRDQLVDWAMEHIGKEIGGGEQEHICIDLKGTLSQAGFEYSVKGATVEVTLDSVVAALSDLVGPGLKAVLDEATATGDLEAEGND